MESNAKSKIDYDIKEDCPKCSLSRRIEYPKCMWCGKLFVEADYYLQTLQKKIYTNSLLMIVFGLVLILLYFLNFFGNQIGPYYYYYYFYTSGSQELLRILLLLIGVLTSLYGLSNIFIFKYKPDYYIEWKKPMQDLAKTFFAPLIALLIPIILDPIPYLGISRNTRIFISLPIGLYIGLSGFYGIYLYKFNPEKYKEIRENIPKELYFGLSGLYGLLLYKINPQKFREIREKIPKGLYFGLARKYWIIENDPLQDGHKDLIREKKIYGIVLTTCFGLSLLGGIILIIISYIFGIPLLGNGILITIGTIIELRNGIVGSIICGIAVAISLYYIILLSSYSGVYVLILLPILLLISATIVYKVAKKIKMTEKKYCKHCERVVEPVGERLTVGKAIIEIICSNFRRSKKYGMKCTRCATRLNRMVNAFYVLFFLYIIIVLFIFPYVIGYYMYP